MAVTTFTEEFSSSVQADRLFKALILDADNLLPKIIPQLIKSVELVEGNGGPGSVKKITTVEGSTAKHLKHRIDAVDKENLTYGYTLIEGEDLGDKVESISYQIKFEATAEGGTKAKNVSNYNLKAGLEIKEEDVSLAREKGLAVFKFVEAYLVANPDAYA